MDNSRVIGVVTAAALLATLSASAREAMAPSEVINAFEETFDVHPGPFLRSRDCICATGEFTGTSAAAALSRSALFTQASVPVVARFTATPDGPGSSNSREMELEFRLSGGSLQHMAMLNTPSFGTSDPVAFGEMIAAVKPDPNTGKPNLRRLHEFLAAHPDAFARSNFVTAADRLTGYASAEYFSLHTFRFIDAAGRTRFVRWRFLPQDAVTTVSTSEAGEAAPDALRERLIKQLASRPVRWDMIVYLGEPADSTDNPSVAWPERRRHLKAGTLTITQATPDGAAKCVQMNFDPLITAEGIAPADDPVLLFRSPTYGRAFSAILAQALAPARTAPVVGR
jgi:catalase